MTPRLPSISSSVSPETSLVPISSPSTGEAVDLNNESDHETLPASNASKDSMLELVEQLTAGVPENRYGVGDLLRLEKKASYEEPGWGKLEVFKFPYRGNYAGRGLAELHITRVNEGGGQTLLTITLDGQPGSLEALIEEFELSPEQAKRGMKPDSWREFVAGIPEDGVLSQHDMLDLALGTHNLVPSRKSELLEGEATKINSALSGLLP